MWGVTDLQAYLVGLVLIILLPGPNSLFVLSVAVRHGVRPGYAAAGGVFVGDAVLMFLSAVGVASVLKANETAFAVVKYLGAGYLAWLAVGLLLAGWRAWRDRAARPAAALESVASRGEALEAGAGAGDGPPAGRGSVAPLRLFNRALVISLLNPKAILFFVAFFVQFVDPTYPNPALSFLVLAVLLEIASFLYLSALILGGSRLASAVRRHRAVSAGGTSLVGLAFLLFAVKLATTSA